MDESEQNGTEQGRNDARTDRAHGLFCMAGTAGSRPGMGGEEEGGAKEGGLENLLGSLLLVEATCGG